MDYVMAVKGANKTGRRETGAFNIVAPGGLTAVSVVVILYTLILISARIPSATRMEIFQGERGFGL